MTFQRIQLFINQTLRRWMVCRLSASQGSLPEAGHQSAALFEKPIKRMTTRLLAYSA